MRRSVDFSSAGGSRLIRLRSHWAVSAINDFMRTPQYVVLIALLTAISYWCSLDLQLYSAFILIGLYLSFFGRDYLPLIPIVICCYIAPSWENNPGRYEGSIFYPENGGIYLFTMVGIFLLSVIFRLITDHDFGGKKFLREKRSLTNGMLVLGAAYLVSGLGMAGYTEVALNNLLFAFIQFLAVFVMYFFFTGAVRWERVPRDYLAWTGMCVGFVVLSQLVENYSSGRIFEGATINRELIATGWGMHNNVGCMIAIMMPFAFYLASHRRHGWLYMILGTVLMLGTIVSCSRTSMAVAVVAYCVCAFFLLRNKESRKMSLRVYVIAALAVLVAVALLFEKLLSVFELFIQQLDDISKRDKLLINGLKQFLGNPVFGGSFYPQGEFVPWDWANLEAFSSFFPPRWHNTLIQIAASCGVVGLAAYAFHRVQTVKLFWKERSAEKDYIAVSVLVLLAASLLDCHFFNVGPVLFYSMSLAFAEKIHRTEV